MVTKDQLLSRLKDVVDPEIGLNIVDLGMVRNVEVDSSGIAKVTIALTVSGCPLTETLNADITNALGGLPEVREVKVDMQSMRPEELEALSSRLQDLKKQQRSLGRAPGLSSGIDKLERKGIQNIIAVVSGKGGVGKSYVSATIARELKRAGYNVGILDADITGPSVAKIFGLSGKPLADEVGVIPAETRLGIKVISMNLLLDKPDTPVIWRGPIINGVIRQLFSDVNWGDLHYLIVDLPPGTGDAPLTVFQSLPVDAAVVVSTPQDLSMLIVLKAINMARQLSVPIAGVVENMSYLKCPHCLERIEMFADSGIERSVERLGVPFLGRLPFDPAVNRLADAGKLEEYTSRETTQLVKNVRSRVTSLTGLTASPIAWKDKTTTAPSPYGRVAPAGRSV